MFTYYNIRPRWWKFLIHICFHCRLWNCCLHPQQDGSLHQLSTYMWYRNRICESSTTEIRTRVLIADTIKRKWNGSDCFLGWQLRYNRWKRSRWWFCTYNTFTCILRTNWKHFLRIYLRFSTENKKPENQCQWRTSSNPICRWQERASTI